MRWHVALIAEAILIVVICWRKPGLRWFAALIGVDFMASVLQLLLYRGDFRMLSRLIWLGGVGLAAPLNWMALMEMADPFRESPAPKSFPRMAHGVLLSAWISVNLLCVTLQTQPGWVIPVNHVMLIAQTLLFIAWSVLFWLF